MAQRRARRQNRQAAAGLRDGGVRNAGVRPDRQGYRLPKVVVYSGD